MPWNKDQIKKHKEAARLLCLIKAETFNFIHKNKINISEYKTQEFIFQKFKEYNLKTDRGSIIVAFGKNTQFVHYYPSKHSRKLTPNSSIMLDIWARLNEKEAPFADITWMAYYGNKIPKEFLNIFQTTIRARDRVIKYIQTSLKKKIIPTGVNTHVLARDYIDSTKYKGKFPHSIGHSIGLTSPHGREGQYRKRQKPLTKNLGYTIEPGIYLAGKYGARSEIDFYIDRNNKMIITTEVQNKLIKI